MKNRLRPNDVRAARRAGMAAAVMAGVIAGGIAAVPADAASVHKAGGARIGTTTSRSSGPN